MALADELPGIAARAAEHAQAGEAVTAVVAAEPWPGRRVYLCTLEGGGERAWVALHDDGEAVADRRTLRDAVSIAALCELAVECAAGGDIDDLRAQLVAVRIGEGVAGIEEVEAALDELERVVGSPPQVATPERLDAISSAARALERELGEIGASPFAAAMKAASPAVEELLRDVEAAYRGELA